MPKVTPMLTFLRALTKDQRKEFAITVGTTTTYFYQIAAQVEPNPRLRLALAIRDESWRVAKTLMTPPLTLEDLLVGMAPATE